MSLELEAQFLDRGTNHRHSRLEAAVDQDVPVRRRDQEGRELLGAHVVDVADHLVRRERLVPVGLLILRACITRHEGNEKQEHEDVSHEPHL